jgi:hypothetical protein
MEDEPFSIIFPDYFADYATEIEAKGYFADLLIDFGDTHLRPNFYDLPRLTQECEDAFKTGQSHFSVANLIVLPAVTRENIEKAIRELAMGGFADLMPSDEEASGL